jgi:LuxR family transcriptional regulator, maltose regulon positive regulatory protein
MCTYRGNNRVKKRPGEMTVDLAKPVPAQRRRAGHQRTSSPLPTPVLLGAKLARPQIPAGYLERPRISNLLDAGSDTSLTIVSAGPGWGKTSAVAAWAEHLRDPIAWVSLDAEDGEPRMFWSYVLAALRAAATVPADNPLADLVPRPVPDAETTRLIVDGLNRLPTRVGLVLDDLHEVGSAVVLEAIEALLRRRIDRLRLVLITRSDPTLPLHRLRLAGDLTEIRAADLAFTADEAVALFVNDGLDTGAVPMSRLLERTEGWAAGLRLAALALRRDASGSALAEFAYDERATADYLADEVLAGQPAELRTFLLHTSVVDRLTADLADALTGDGDGASRLERLTQANAFVVALGTEGHWYRYHPMLREMLRQHLSMSEPHLVAALHRRAALWFASHGSPVEAVRHAAMAPDWGLLGRVLVTRAVPRLVSADRDALAGVLARLPDADGHDGFEVHLSAAARLLSVRQFAAMAPHVSLGWSALRRTEPDLRPAATVALHVLELAQARIRGDADAIVMHSTRALDLLRGEAASVPAADEYTAITLGNQGMGLLWSGAQREAERSLREGLAAAQETDVEVTRVDMLGHLGLAATLSGRLREAHVLASEAVELAGARGWSALEQVSSAYLTLAFVALQWNELEEADAQLRLGLAAQPTWADRLPLTALRITEVMVHAVRGRLARAREGILQLRSDFADWHAPEFLLRWGAIAAAEVALTSGDHGRVAEIIAVPTGDAPPGPEERVCLARALLAAGQPDRALQMVSAVRDLDTGAAVDAWLITALAADHNREDHRANAAIAKALQVAEPEAWRRPFVTAHPDRLARLVDRVIRLTPQPSQFARSLLTELDRQGFRVDGQVREPLTDRELTVLEHLPTMLSNAEIATQMFVSVNTVKAHLKSLYRKLDVSSRRQAVQRARELQLL